MRRYFIFAAIALQVLVLAFMAGQREWILATGQVVYLRTAPIDPRDPFRGDFVRLRYAFNQALRSQLEVSPEETLAEGTIVYARFDADPRNVGVLRGFSLQQPQEGLFLRGRSRYRWRDDQDFALQLRYGIETYFVEQGYGLEMERRQGRRDSLQIPLEMEVAVGSDGTGIIRGHRWSPLGIHLERLDQDDTDETPPRFRLGLMNTTDIPLGVMLLPNACALTLESANHASHPRWRLAHDPCAEVVPQAEHLRILAPGERHDTPLDFADPRWHVQDDDGQVLTINELNNQRFRLVFRASHPAALDQSREDLSLWQGELPSPAFWATGRVD